MGQGLTLLTLSDFNYFPKGLISKCSRIGGWASTQQPGRDMTESDVVLGLSWP